jgi:hypothetical protein
MMTGAFLMHAMSQPQQVQPQVVYVGPQPVQQQVAAPVQQPVQQHGNPLGGILKFILGIGVIVLIVKLFKKDGK